MPHNAHDSKNQDFLPTSNLDLSNLRNSKSVLSDDFLIADDNALSKHDFLKQYAETALLLKGENALVVANNQQAATLLGIDLHLNNASSLAQFTNLSSEQFEASFKKIQVALKASGRSDILMPVRLANSEEENMLLHFTECLINAQEFILLRIPAVTHDVMHIGKTSIIKDDILIDYTDDFIWSLTPSFHLIKGNKVFINQYKQTTGKSIMPGDYLLGEGTYTKDLLATWAALYKQASNGVLFTKELEGNAFGDNTTAWLEVKFVPVMNDDELQAIVCYAKNITDKKQLEQKWEENNHRLIEAQHVAKLGSWQRIFDNNETYWSDETYNIFEIDKSKFAITEHTYYEFVHPSDIERVKQAFKKEVNPDEENCLVHKIITQKGNEKYVEQRWKIFADKTNAPILISGTCQDVSERVKSDKDLNFKGKLLNNIGQSTIATDIAGNITYWNAGAQKLFGWTADEVLGKSMLEVAPTKQSLAESEAVIAQLANGAVWEGEMIVKNKEGNELPIYITCAPIEDNDGRLVGMMGVSNNISEQKAVEQTLLIKEEQLSVIYKTIAENIFLFQVVPDIGFKFLSVNRTGSEAEGNYPENFVGKYAHKVLPAETWELANVYYNKAVALNTTVQWDQVLNTSKGQITTTSTATPVNDIKGNCTQLVVSTTDITKCVEAAKKITEGEELYKDLFTKSLTGIYETSVEGIILNCNEAFAVMLKYQNADELIGTRATALYNDVADRAKFISSLTKEGAIKNNEAALKCKDGSVLYILENTSVKHNRQGALVSIEGMILDISDRKLAEAVLAESNERFVNIGKATNEAIWELDLTVDGIFWGANYEPLFGHPVSNELETLSNWYGHVHPEDAERITTSMKLALDATDCLQWTDKYRYQRADKSYAYVSDKGFIVRDNEGQAVKVVGAMRDVTESRNKEFELQQSEARLKGILASQSSYVVRADLQGNYTYYNEKFLKDFNFLNPGAPLLQNNCRLTTMEYHYPIVDQALQNAAANPNTIIQIELDKKTATSAIRYTLWEIVCLTDASGEPSEIQCIGIDITNRKSIQKELISSLQERNEILESIGDAFFAVDHQFKIAYWNAKATQITGLSKLDVKGKTFDEVYPEIIGEELMEKIKDAILQKRIMQFDSYSGVYKTWFEVSIYPASNGSSIYLRDINERKKAEEEIRISKERFDMVSIATNDVTWDWDVKTGIIIRSNANMEKVFGYKLGPADENEHFWNSLIHPGDKLRSDMILAEAMVNADLVFLDAEYRVMKANGAYAYVYDKGFIIRDYNGDPIRIIGAVQDITKLKEGELMLQKRADELAASNRELEQFAYVASHDLQEPLRMVSGFLTQLNKKYADVLDDKGKKYIHFAVDGATRMRQIILDLLEYSRIGRYATDKESIDLNKLLSEIVLLHSTTIDTKHASIRIDNLPTIVGYRSPLRQLFQNIISNALMFSDPHRLPEIFVTAKAQDGYWLFSVSDNGIGINKEYFSKIFTIFQRLHTRDEYPGTGLGLAIAKKIVESFEGQIWLTSEEGKGTTFFFTLKNML